MAGEEWKLSHSIMSTTFTDSAKRESGEELQGSLSHDDPSTCAYCLAIYLTSTTLITCCNTHRRRQHDNVPPRRSSEWYQCGHPRAEACCLLHPTRYDWLLRVRYTRTLNQSDGKSADDDETSATWENEWLAGNHQTDSEDTPHADIPSVIKSKTVLLRLDYGTKEASFLSAFCPIDEAPTLVIIHNGTVVDKLEGNLEYTEWAQRLLKACGSDAQGADASELTQAQEPTTPAPAAVETNDEASEGAAVPLEPASGSAAPSLPGVPTEHQPENIQALLTERGQRLEAERLRREGREKAERIARARAIREEQERAQSQVDKGKQRADDPESAKNKARIDWVQQQAKRKQEAKEEKQRILSRIEADKRERKNREAERKQAATAMAGEPLPSQSSALPGSGSTRMPPTSGTCALQVRLFDGSSIKGRFKHDSTLATAVREWIKETSPAGGADIPYNFRQILTPHPSRTIEISEEGQTLSDVGLMPTATLVLVPVAGFTEAYTSSGGGGILGSAYGLVTGAFGLAGSALGYVTGIGSSSSSQGGEGIYMGGTADEQEPSNVQGSRMANADSGTAQSGPSRIRVKTMAEQRAESEKGAEFYNGNSLGTEGRKDDDDGADRRQ